MLAPLDLFQDAVALAFSLKAPQGLLDVLALA